MKSMKMPSQSVRDASTSEEKQNPLTGTELPLLQVSLTTLGGSFFLGLLAWVLGRGSLGLGLALGGFLSLFSLYGLKILTSRALAIGGTKSMWVFHIMNLVRWFLLAIICYLLLKISVACLLGAVGSYMWFLAVLAWFGLRSARNIPSTN